MNAPRTASAAALAACVASLASCFPSARKPSADGCGGPHPEWPPPPLASLGQDAEPVLLSHAPHLYAHRFERERSGTTETLRAVVFEHGRSALVVGDRGTALLRDATGWRSEPTGTGETLNAVVKAPRHETTAAKTAETAPEDVSYVAVGANGAAVLRGPDGIWHAETTGTSADLYGLFNGWRFTLAVGAGGAMLQRSPDGVWRQISTRTNADLYSVGLCKSYVQEHFCAVGAHGTIVDCMPSDTDFVCIPRGPLTDRSLHVLTQYGLVLGDGVWLRPAPVQTSEPPIGYELWNLPGANAGDDEPRAASANNWIGISEVLIAGRHGAVWLVLHWFPEKENVTRLSLPYGVDFHGAAFDLVDGFVVGDSGTIVKIALEGYDIGPLCGG